ncbi:hypothetical protein VTN77DRAFT_6098 [Rasamsonia byssochlamydoides]|uniref:uncharacterized protein n=1 Tax=Rasamsonia byssochlamydoides TaxID=89139 RepID=UPI0037438890
MASYSQTPTIFDDAIRPASKPSVFRSIMPLRSHKRSPSAGDALVPRPVNGINPFEAAGFLPADHPHAQPLGERPHNRDAAGGVRQQQSSFGSTDKQGLHKKTKSSVSLKALIRDREKKESKSTDATDEQSVERKMKKAKSAASLSAILKRSQRGRKGEPSRDARDKENQSPMEVTGSPIWAQFAAPPLQEQSGKVYVPESCRTFEEEVSLYTPKQYNPSKQRNFYDYHQPSLTQKPRPKSDYISASTMKVKEMLERNLEKVQSRSEHRRMSSESQSSDGSKKNSNPKRNSRVMAVVSALNAREAETQRELDPKQIESDFEKLLDARNVPQNMREKMRSLDTSIKADFIQKDRSENSCPNSATSSSFDSAGRQRGRREAWGIPQDKSANDNKSVRSQSRGRTFGLSKGDVSSPKKHHKSESGSSHKRPKSIDFGRPTSMASISTISLPTTAHTDPSADPADFIHYLREVQKPEIVEVGKMHKLRILLRNETVSWVDAFISDGGMDEVIQLLYRIMKVEWREEHEDNLLHETLLCLKALCTTSLALKQLTRVEGELFPALLKMLFDEEKKGPSEFTTRGIIINLLFTHLSTASPDEMPTRASKILSYLRDPTPESQPLEFIAQIYRPRPYRVWCKEVTNVTKEVFWIFLHHLNVVPLVRQDDASSGEDYLKRHFPAPRPPVPAAPYVGGVEWDATNYLAAHLDLMNGLIASLPTREERNALREDLRASGFEKVMGGSLRTCKEKFYSAVHDCLKTWVAAAAEDGWEYAFVREGPEPGSPPKSPVKNGAASPKKNRIDEPPKLSLGLSFDKKGAETKHDNELGGWL